jgi:ABC-type amino acid transport substrate-binding protein
LEGIVLLPLAEPRDGLNAVVTGEAHAALVDAITLRQFPESDLTLKAVGPPVVSVPYVIAVPIEAPELLKAIDAALVSLQEEGRLEQIEAEWLGS